MSDRGRLLVGLAVIALVALGVTLLPGGGAGIEFVLDVLSALFLVALAAMGWRLYRSQQFWLNALTDTQRGVLYGAVASAAFVIAANPRFSGIEGGRLVQYMLLGICAGAVYWVWDQSRRHVI
jgi:hypothetical protein